MNAVIFNINCEPITYFPLALLLADFLCFELADLTTFPEEAVFTGIWLPLLAVLSVGELTPLV